MRGGEEVGEDRGVKGDTVGLEREGIERLVRGHHNLEELYSERYFDEWVSLVWVSLSWLWILCC
jgi:hypothetical protein